MDLTDIHTIRRILGENKIKPNKRLGQNLLVAKPPLIRLIESAQIKTDDIVVEIGSGLGTLTQELAKRAGRVLAVEKDYNFIDWLRRYFKSSKNVKIIHQDILQFSMINDQNDIKGIPRQARNDNQEKSYTLHATRYKIVANLPYQITSPVLRKFLTSENPPTTMVLMVQKEVAQRICAKPGDSERGFLTVLVEFYGKAEIIDYVDRSSFWPSPEIDSAIIKIVTYGYNRLLKVNNGYEEPKVTLSNSESAKLADEQSNLNVTSFFRLVKAGFSQKRRQIHHPLRANLHISKDEIFAILKKAEIEPTKRAEELSLEEWIQLYKIISLQ